MKKISTLIAIACMNLFLNAQTAGWQWAQNSNGTSSDGGKAICADAYGNTYVTGYYTSTSITIGTTTLTNSGGYDYFIAKYNAMGNVVWAKGATGVSNDIGTGICLDAKGNPYVTGSTNSATLTVGSNVITQKGYDDIFVVKYDTSGKAIWAKSFGGSSDDLGQSVGVDGKGNAYVTGYYTSSSMIAGTNTLTNAGGNDMFVAKYDSSGNIIWAKSIGGTGAESGNGISTDVNGNSYVTGSYTSSSITFGATTLTNSGGYDYFITKYGPLGNVIWSKGATGVSNDIGYGLTLNANKYVYVIGSYNSANLTFGSSSINGKSGDDVFIVKYDTSGTALWAETAGGYTDDLAGGIAVDANGNAFITGYFESPTMYFGLTTLTNAGADNIFAASYDASGNLRWAKSAGGSSDDEGTSVTVDAMGNAYMTGSFYSATITFGNTTLTNVSGYSDMYIAKFGTTNTTGIKEVSTMQTGLITISPNPNTGIFSLQTEGLQNSSSDTYMSIIDMLGREVYQGKYNQVNTIDFSTQANGVYYVIINNTDKKYTGKIIVNK
jgi:hypothetical protein